MARVKSRVNLFGCLNASVAVCRSSAVSAILGNFLHIHENAGTIRYICGHTCAKTQHKPLSQKKMHAQIAAM